MDADEVLTRFDAVEMDEEQVRRVGALRTDFKNVAMAIVMRCPAGRARNIALTELESASHWAVKAIAHG